jgi:hypothetical protein
MIHKNNGDGVSNRRAAAAICCCCSGGGNAPACTDDLQLATTASNAHFLVKYNGISVVKIHFKIFY